MYNDDDYENDPEKKDSEETETDTTYSYSKDEIIDNPSYNGGSSESQDSTQSQQGSYRSGNSYDASYPYANSYSTGSQNVSQNNSREKKSEGSSFGPVKTVVLALCCAVIGGLIGAGFISLIGGSSLTSSSGGNTEVLYEGSRPSSTIVISDIDTSSEMTAAEVYASNVSSTVGIVTTITTNYFGFETTSAASGSGFILTEDGCILTNYHVIEGYSEVKVSLYDGSTYEAQVLGYDESNDIALLKIDAEGLVPVVLGDSDNMNIGDTVIAIGNPLGELTFSLTEGVISAMDRSVTLSSGITMSLIQTDCAINSGNSGGALFNMYGEVIGITNAKYSSSGSSSEASIDNIGFAIPINSVKSIITSIIEDGTIRTSYIGVTVTDMTMEAAASSGVTQGAVIYGVTEGGPADEAGIMEGDVITAINGTQITGKDDLKSFVTASEGGDELVCTVHRNGEIIEITVIVGVQYNSALPEESVQESDSEYNYIFPFSPWGNSYGDDNEAEGSSY